MRVPVRQASSGGPRLHVPKAGTARCSGHRAEHDAGSACVASELDVRVVRSATTLSFILRSPTAASSGAIPAISRACGGHGGARAGDRDAIFFEVSAPRREQPRVAHDVLPIVNNHALVDGNKRLGWLTTAVFLELNDVRATRRRTMTSSSS